MRSQNLVYQRPSTITNRDISGGRGQAGERIVALTVAIEGGKSMREYNHDYATSLSAFKALLGVGLANAESEGDGRKPIVDIEPGRKFDKVRVLFLNGDKTTKPEVRFFVEHSTGNVYGMKSPVAPNLNQFFGTIYDAKLWDYSKRFPEPYDCETAGVVCVGGYETPVGRANHYVVKGQEKKRIDGRTKTGKKIVVEAGAE